MDNLNEPEQAAENGTPQQAVGMWAAEEWVSWKNAKALLGRPRYGLARSRSDVLGKIRKDFATAGVVQSDEQILRVMTQSWLEAGSREQTTRADASDAALVQIARNFQSRTDAGRF